jgi:hypothetical protein
MKLFLFVINTSRLKFFIICEVDLSKDGVELMGMKATGM